MYKGLTLFLLLLILASCGQRMSHEWQYAADAVAMTPMAPTPQMPAPQAMAPGYVMMLDDDFPVDFMVREMEAPAARLIIQTAFVQLESEYFDNAVDLLRGIPTAFGGYSESERLFPIHTSRQFEIIMRIPAAEFENALSQIQEVAETRSLSVSAEDVTDLFFDTESRLETRLVEEDRILALIDQTSRINDLLELERRLASTRLQIERYRSSLANLESRITFSTIRVHLFDIEDVPLVVASVTFGERIGGAFGTSIDGTLRVFQFILIVLAGAIVPLLLVTSVAFLLVKLYRKKNAVVRP